MHSEGTVKTEAGGAIAENDMKRMSWKVSWLLVIKATGMVGALASIRRVMSLPSLD